ncbi:unnamed protein product [Rotaria socialis]
MNPRIEKLCLPRHRRDAVWKFWQPNAKMEKIHPPLFWKTLDYKNIQSKKTTKLKKSKNEYSCLNACNYTTLVYRNASNEKGFHVFADFEHDGLQHATWKQSTEEYYVSRAELKNKNDKLSIIEFPWLDLNNNNNKHHFFNSEYLKRQELGRYFKTHREKDNLFELDKSSYPNRPIPMSRRPQDALHIDFYPSAQFEGSKTEATFKTFYHRKYLLPQHLREHTIKNLIDIGKYIQLEIDIIGHFVLHPNELSKHEIKMFDLTSEFGDLYEGHIIRINKEKLVLLLASTYYSDVKLAQSEDLEQIINNSIAFDTKINSQSTLEQIVVDHVRTYLQTNNNYSISQIRRIQIELEPLMNQEKRQVNVHLIADEDIIETLTIEITREQEPKLFDIQYEDSLYFLQSINEQKMIHSVERKLKQLYAKRYSLIKNEENHYSYLQLTLDMEYDTINSIEKMFYAYVNHTLTKYSRDECMRIAIEYSFDDLLDELDSNEIQPINNRQLQMMTDDVQVRLRLQIERRLKAETTAKILLMGPSMKTSLEIEAVGKEVVVLDHHREIFISKSNTHIDSVKIQDMQRNNGKIIFHEEIEGGPTSFDRLPMSIDSLTILTRIQQRKRLALEENDNNVVLLGSGVHRLVTCEDPKPRVSFSIDCEQSKTERKSSPHLHKGVSIDEHGENSIETFDTVSINTKSYNTSANTRQQRFFESCQTNEDNQQARKKRMSRSPAEYGKHRQKRKKRKEYQTTSETITHNTSSKESFFNNLLLLQQSKIMKSIVSIKNCDRKQTYAQQSNAKTENSETEGFTLKSRTRLENNRFMKSAEDLSQIKEVIDDNKTRRDNRINQATSLKSLHDNRERQDPYVNEFFDILKNETQYSSNIDQINDESFQDNEDDGDDSKENYNTERYLRSLYGSLSTTMKQVDEMYQSKSSRLRSSLDLANIFINFLHIRKDIAYEIASAIIDARQHLIEFPLTEKSSSSTMFDDASISSSIVTAEDSDTAMNESSYTSRSMSKDAKNQNHLKKRRSNPAKNKITYSSTSQRVMNRIITYLSEVDWRVFNYITKHFLQKSTMITRHALEFSSALLIDLIEDSVYQIYFHSKWCSDTHLSSRGTMETNPIESLLVEEFFKKSLCYLFNRLHRIESPLLESIALMQTLKTYTTTSLLKEFASIESHAVPIGLDPCIWFSTNLLIKTICSLTDDILKQMNREYLSDHTKFEYVLISYFRKIQIVNNLQDIIEINKDLAKSKSSSTLSNNKYLLHIIDLNQAPKFFSDQAFKRFKFGGQSQLNDDIEVLKDLVLLDIKKHNIKTIKRSYVPLTMNDLVVHQQNRVLFPSPWLLAQYQQRLEAQNKTSINDDHLRENSYRFDEINDFAKTDNLSADVRTLLDNIIRKYATVEENLGVLSHREGLSEEDLTQLIENAIEAVQRFDRENNIGDRKLQNKKTINNRLIEFFKYAGRHGVRLLDDVLKLAKLRSNDPKKYIPLAVNMFKERLKSTGGTRPRKQTVRFAYTLETLFMATNDEPALIAKMLRRKSDENKPLTTELDSLQQIIEKEDNKKIDTSFIELEPGTNTPPYSTELFTTGKYRQSLPTIDETAELTLSSNITEDVDRPFYSEGLLSSTIMSHIGLTVAQLIVLITGHNEKPLQLTNTQIEQICAKQDLTTAPIQSYLQKLLEEVQLTDEFKLTEEQLIQIAIEENISLADVERVGVLEINLKLNENQVQRLTNQIDLINSISSTLELSQEKEQSWLVLHLDQLIELCHQQRINIDKLLDNEIDSQNSSVIDVSKIKFTISPLQIVHLVNQYNFNIRKLIFMEQNLKNQSQQTQRFRLNSLQLAYLFAHRRIVNNHDTVGLTISHLIGIYMLLHKSNENDQFSLNYQQIKQLALIQNMSMEHFHSLSGSKESFQLTHNQLIHIAIENKILLKEIVSIPNNQKSKILDLKQLCAVISQHSQSSMMHKSFNRHIQQSVYLNVEQIFSLVKFSNIELSQLTTCTTGYIDRTKFRFKPEQLATLWDMSISIDDFERRTSLSPFILSDEQFSSLLGSITTFDLSKNFKLTSVSPLIQTNESIDNKEVLTDRRKLRSSTLADQLAAMHKRLQSSIKAHSDVVGTVSKSILQRHRIENTLNRVHQLSVNSIDEISTKEIETMPPLIIDLLKVDSISENIYNSIKQDEPDKSGNLNKVIVEGIQTGQLSFSQIYKIQTQLLTPNLIDEFKSGHLSKHILDAYSSQSELQITHRVHSSAAQLNRLFSQQSSSISQLDTTMVPVLQQTTTQHMLPSNIVSKDDDLNVKQQIASDEYEKKTQTNHQNPIIVFSKSTNNRQQILQDLRDCLDDQLVELKKEYGIEPAKGKTSIRHMTSRFRTMAGIDELETLIDRQIDEVDLLNILNGHTNDLINQANIDSNEKNVLFNRNAEHRLNRINERIDLVNILQNDIENRRLRRQLTPEELTAFIFEDIHKFEQLTKIHLRDDDLRILSMNRFSSLEQSITRHLTESEYRYLLQNELPFDYIEQALLRRPLTIEERSEQEELTLQPYQDLVPDKNSIVSGKFKESLTQKNVQLTHAQLQQILQYRAQVVDEYDIIHSISPSVKLIEDQINRPLTIDEKKRLTQDDYSMIKPIQNENYSYISGRIEETHSMTTSLLENVKDIELEIGRVLTNEEIIMVLHGDIIGLEQTFNSRLSIDIIKSMRNNQINRNLTDKQIRDILNGIEQILDRQSTPTGRSTDEVTQLSHTSPIDAKVQELADVLKPHLTADQQIAQSDINKIEQNHATDLTILQDESDEDLFIFHRLVKQKIYFNLSEIETAIGRNLNSNELARFADSRFAHIESDLGRSLSDVQRSNLLNGKKLTIETLIRRPLSPEESGPHLVDLTNIQRILNRSLTFDELTNLAGDRFDEICKILQRPLKIEELIDLLNGNYISIIKIIDEKLNKKKDEELHELPINRIRHFESILDRKLSHRELLRVAETRFEPILRLLSDFMKPEQIFDLASGRYDKIETFFNRSLTQNEKYELEKSLLQTHVKYPIMLDELEYIIQRRLNEPELRALIGDQYHDIEKGLGKTLLEKQIRNILYENDDQSLNEVADLVDYFKRKYRDDQKRTKFIVNQLIEKLDEDYKDHSMESSGIKHFRPLTPSPSVQQKQSDIEFHQSTIELLERLSDDVRKHQPIKRQESSVDAHSSKIFDEKSILSYDESKTSPNDSLSSRSILSYDGHEVKSSQAFKNITRIVESIADKEYVEEMATVTDAITAFQDKLHKHVDRPSSRQTATAWLSNLNKETKVSYLPAIESIEKKTTNQKPQSSTISNDDDLYLGWKLFKSIDRPELGLKEEKPRMINVKHIAQTYVVGIPEEYADTKTKSKSIRPRLPKTRIIQETTEFVSQLFHLPIISDATHFIVPFRTYNDIIEPVELCESDMIDIEDDELQMRDSPETLEWYEECIQRNAQIHAQIPTEYQPSIVHCHTGRQMIITPAKRAEQRKTSTGESIEKSKELLESSEPRLSEDRSTLNSGFIQRLSQPMFDIQSIEHTSTTVTVTDLIMHTVATSQKSNLLEALEELFSQENLDTYQITESDWHDLFLLLLNSYLRSHSINRKEIFQRLTEKLHDLRKNERRRSTDFYPNISVVLSPTTDTRNTLIESPIAERLTSPFESFNSFISSNDSEYNQTGLTTDQSSINTPVKKNSSMQSLPQNNSSKAKSKAKFHDLVGKKTQTSINKISPSPIEYIANENKHSSVSMKNRRYKITVIHSDDQCKTPTQSTKLPPIVTKKKPVSRMLIDSQLLSSSSTIRK